MAANDLRKAIDHCNDEVARLDDELVLPDAHCLNLKLGRESRFSFLDKLILMGTGDSFPGTNFFPKLPPLTVNIAKYRILLC